MRIIKDREIVEDNWLHLDDDAELLETRAAASAWLRSTARTLPVNEEK